MRKLDTAEFLHVFDATKDGLYRLFQKQTNDRAEVEDLVQESYLRLWEKREGLQDPTSYVFGIAYNLVKEFHRKRISSSIQLMETEALPEMQDPHSPHEQYQFKETRQTVREIINGLSPEKKAAFVLIKEEERSYKEVSDLLDVPVSTLEKQVSGSIRILRKALYLLVIFSTLLSLL